MPRHFSLYLRVLPLLGLASCLLSLPAGAATFIVTNLNNSGLGSLRQAISDANAAAGDDSIVFQSGLSGTIILTSGELVISGNCAINGPGANVLAVNGNHTSRIFNISIGTTIAIDGLTLKSGRPAAGIGGGIIIGGGIYNAGKLTISNSSVSGNVAGSNSFGGGAGGGIWNESGTLIVMNSALVGNTAGSGAAIHNQGGLLMVMNSTLSSNSVTASGSGGGISNQGTVRITHSTVSRNSAYYGGGVSNSFGTVTITNSTLSSNSAQVGGGAVASEGTLTIINSTLSGNSAVHYGGGIESFGFSTLTITSSTLSNNSAQAGGGIYNLGTMTLGDSLVTGNIAPMGKEISNDTGIVPPAMFISHGHNLFGENGASGVVGGTLDPSDTVPTVGIGAILSPLGNYGGPTETHFLVPDSPGIDAGDNALIPPDITTDQRGFPRIQNGTVDIGAVEAGEVSTTAVPTLSQWALLVLGLLLAGAGLTQLRRTHLLRG